MEDGKDKPGFVVKDRRKVSLDDLDQQPEQPDAATQPAGEQPDAATQQPQSEQPEKQVQEEKAVPLPEVSFSTFVFSLSSSALVHLGEVPEPSTNRTRTDLPMAKQIIDTLGMLDEKTKGNLAADEDNLLKTVLYDLRMRYIQKSSK